MISVSENAIHAATYRKVNQLTLGTYDDNAGVYSSGNKLKWISFLV